MNRQTKVKILATIGPSCDSEEMLLKLIDSGASAFRLNFSHGDEEYFTNLFGLINGVCEKRKMPIPIVQDLQGPKIRIGKLEREKIKIRAGEKIEITVDKVKGNERILSTSYKGLVKDATIGEIILIDDGLIRVVVEERKKQSLVCSVKIGGKLKSKKGMNLPGMKLSTPSLTERDKTNLDFALKHRVDYIALSFVRKAEDIVELRNWLEERGHTKQIIAKIEKPEAVDNFESILEVADAIMVARGDLGVEIPAQEVPLIQKQLVLRAKRARIPVIIATQMMETMITSLTPTIWIDT